MYHRIILLGALALASVSATAQRRSPSQAASQFTLDSVAPTPAATPSPDASPTAVPPVVPENAAVTATPTPTAVATPASPVVTGVFTLDTPIKLLIADPGAKAVLDRELPGLSEDENLAKFADLGLRQFQPLTGGQLTDAMLVKVARGLTELSMGPSVAPLATPTPRAGSRRNRDTSR